MRRSHACVFTVLVVLACRPTPANGEHATTEVGWWTRSPVASAPDGGIAIALAPDGPLTVAAMRTPRPSHVERIVFEAVEVGGIATNGASVLACAAGADWEPASGGPFRAAPVTACPDGIPLTRDAASATWHADLTPLAAGGRSFVSIALTPDSATATTGAGFEIRLARPRLILHFGTTATEPTENAVDQTEPTENAVDHYDTAPSPYVEGGAPLPASRPPPVRSKPEVIPPPALTPPEPAAQQAAAQPSLPIAPAAGKGDKPSAGRLVAISLAFGSTAVVLRKARRAIGRIAPRGVV